MKKLNQVLVEVLKVEESQITDQMSPVDVDTWDSIELFFSYVLERKYGLFPTVAEMMDIIEGKCSFPMLIDLRDIFHKDHHDDLTIQYKKFFLNFTVFLQIMDDYADMEKDYGTQPNLVLSIAKQYYPQEFNAIVEILEKAKVNGGVSAPRVGLKYFLNTNRKWLSFAFHNFKQVVVQKPAISSLASFYATYRIFGNKFQPRPEMAPNKASQVIATDAAMDILNGGIDLTADKTLLEINNEGDKVRFDFDPAWLRQLQDASGFVPVIVNVQPMDNLNVFLNIK